MDTKRSTLFYPFWSFVIQATLFFCKINEVSWILKLSDIKHSEYGHHFSHRSACKKEKLYRSWIIIKQEMSNFLNLQPIWEIATQIYLWQFVRRYLWYWQYPGHTVSIMKVHTGWFLTIYVWSVCVTGLVLESPKYFYMAPKIGRKLLLGQKSKYF